jgi:transcriptional regulator with XRE-family HTH domain
MPHRKTVFTRSVGRLIRTLRTRRGYSRDDLGALLPTPVLGETIGNYERGHCGIGVARLFDITTALETSLPWLMSQALRCSRSCGQGRCVLLDDPGRTRADLCGAPRGDARDGVPVGS